MVVSTSAGGSMVAVDRCFKVHQLHSTVPLAQGISTGQASDDATPNPECRRLIHFSCCTGRSFDSSVLPQRTRTQITLGLAHPHAFRILTVTHEPPIPTWTHASSRQDAARREHAPHLHRQGREPAPAVPPQRLPPLLQHRSHLPCRIHLHIISRSPHHRWTGTPTRPRLLRRCVAAGMVVESGLSS